MNKIISAIALTASLTGIGGLADACVSTNDPDGNVVDRRRLEGGLKDEVKVKDGVTADSAVWVQIDDADWEACNIGARYPECTETQ